MNTTMFKPGDVCVVLHPERFLFTLCGDDNVWYDEDGKSSYRQPSGFMVGIGTVVEMIRSGVVDSITANTLAVPDQLTATFFNTTKLLRQILDLPKPKMEREFSLNPSIQTARNVLGCPGTNTPPSEPAIHGASKLQFLIAAKKRIEKGVWGKNVYRIKTAVRYLLNCLQKKEDDLLLSPLSYTVLANAVPGETCCFTKASSISYGISFGQTWKYGHGAMLMFVPSEGVIGLRETTIIPASSVERARDVLRDPRTQNLKDPLLGEAVSETVRLLKLVPRLGTFKGGPVVDPERVLGIHAIKEAGLPTPHVPDLLRAHLLHSLHTAFCFPLKIPCMEKRIAVAISAAAAVLKN